MLGYFGTTITNATVEYHVTTRNVARIEMQRGFLEAQLIRQDVPSRQVMLTSGEYMGLYGGGNTTPSCGPATRHACNGSMLDSVQERTMTTSSLVVSITMRTYKRSLGRPLTLTRVPLHHTAQSQHHERHVKCVDIPRFRTGLVELERSSS